MREARGFFSAPELSACAVPREAPRPPSPLASRGRRRAGAFAPPAGRAQTWGQRGVNRACLRGVRLALPEGRCWSPWNLLWTIRLESQTS